MLKNIIGFSAGLLILLSLTANAADIVTKNIAYDIDGQSFTGFLAYDQSIKEKRPGVIVVHEWWGANDYAHKRGKDLAKEGYVAFALDMYGT
ncbi:MAG: dienelactone hydrolase family protein, partial [Pseudomonadales bacterium]|nr:dienelactone hydrolase family protein [Pseudomonadales bacterium]